MPTSNIIKALLTICWRQGIKRDTRLQFWSQLFSILKNNQKVFKYYLTDCAHLEHFLEYRQIVKDEIQEQINLFLAEEMQC